MGDAEAMRDALHQIDELTKECDRIYHDYSDALGEQQKAEDERDTLREAVERIFANHYCPVFHSLSPVCDVCDAQEWLENQSPTEEKEK